MDGEYATNDNLSVKIDIYWQTHVADSAQAEYCSSFRVCVSASQCTGVTSHISPMCDLAVWDLVRRRCVIQLNMASLVVVVINSSLVTGRRCPAQTAPRLYPRNHEKVKWPPLLAVKRLARRTLAMLGQAKRSWRRS